ncbi:MAG: hypothetical protein V4594_21810 [Bacteroidota bacterium]
METLRFQTGTTNHLLIALTAALIMLFGSCKGGLQPAFVGTYVNSAGSEASMASDTLIVELDHGNSYFIHRKTGFQLLDEAGKAGPLQHESEEWTAVYDPKTEVMRESRNGKVITFDTENGVMRVGKRKYKRIK